MLHTGRYIRGRESSDTLMAHFRSGGVTDIFLRFTYSITYAAIITAIAGDVAIWGVSKPIDGIVLFFVLPVVLICINSLGVRVSFNVGEVLRQNKCTNVRI